MISGAAISKDGEATGWVIPWRNGVLEAAKDVEAHDMAASCVADF